MCCFVNEYQHLESCNISKCVCDFGAMETCFFQLKRIYKDGEKVGSKLCDVTDINFTYVRVSND